MVRQPPPLFSVFVALHMPRSAENLSALSLRYVIKKTNKDQDSATILNAVIVMVNNIARIFECFLFSALFVVEPLNALDQHLVEGHYLYSVW